MTKEEMLNIKNSRELFKIIQRDDVDNDVIDYFNNLCREEWLKEHDLDTIYDPNPRNPNIR